RAVGDRTRPHVRSWAAASLVLAAASLAKPSAVTAPALAWIVARAVAPKASRWTLSLALSPLTLLLGVIVVMGIRGQTAHGVVDTGRSLEAATLDVVGGWTMQVGHLLAPSGLLAAYYREPSSPPAIGLACGVLACILALFAACRAPEAPVRAGM